MRQRGLDLPSRLNEIDRIRVMLFNAGGDRQNIRIKKNVLGRKPDVPGQDRIRPRTDVDLALNGIGLPAFIEGHHHHGRPVTLDQVGPFLKDRFAFFEADRIHHAFALHASESGLNHRPLRTVDHDRNATHVRFRRDQIQKMHHGVFRIQHGFVHVDVDDLSASFYLLPSHRQGCFKLAVENQLGKFRGTRDVRSLADVNKIPLRLNRQRFQAAQARDSIHRHHHVGFGMLHGFGNSRNVCGRAPATSPRNVQPAVFGKLPQVRRHALGCFVESAEGVGQARVGIATDVHGGNPGEFLNVGTHLLRTQRAVQPDAERSRVGNRIPERFDGLPRQGPAALIGNGHGRHHRHGHAPVVEKLIDRKQRRLRVERIKDGFHQQKIDAAVHQPSDLFVIGFPQLLKRHGSKGGIIHVRRH